MVLNQHCITSEGMCIHVCVCVHMRLDEWLWMSIYPHILSSAWLVLSSSLAQASLVFKSHSGVTFFRRHSLICPLSLKQPASPGSFLCFPLYCPAPSWSAPLDRWQLPEGPDGVWFVPVPLAWHSTGTLYVSVTWMHLWKGMWVLFQGSDHCLYCRVPPSFLIRS